MTENKRFTYENHKVNDTLTNDVHSSNRVSVNVLNELHEENEELKKENKAFEHHLSELQGENEILTKENEKLKERVKQLQIDNTVIKKRYRALISENKDLNTSKEYWREKCLSKDSYNKLYHKPQVWFTQELKLTDKQSNEIAEAINQSLKEKENKK